MKILITGGKGMLGRTLSKKWMHKNCCIIADLPLIDITEPDSFERAIVESGAKVVIHCAAMTAVDVCESDPQKAYLINERGSSVVATICARHHVRLIAISTDYVFSGEGDYPWQESDRTNPKTVYGKSKLAGEKAIQELCKDSVIIRTAWLYGAGGPSFVHTMVKLAQDNPTRTLKVVNDQHGNPTSTDALAGLIDQVVDHPEIKGVLHGTCQGDTTWYEFAKIIFQKTGFAQVDVQPCSTEEFPRPAPRPHNSALSTQKLHDVGLLPMPYWWDALADFCQTEFNA